MKQHEPPYGPVLLLPPQARRAPASKPAAAVACEPTARDWEIVGRQWRPLASDPFPGDDLEGELEYAGYFTPGKWRNGIEIFAADSATRWRFVAIFEVGAVVVVVCCAALPDLGLLLAEFSRGANRCPKPR